MTNKKQQAFVLALTALLLHVTVWVCAVDTDISYWESFKTIIVIIVILFTGTVGVSWTYDKLGEY